MLIGITDAPDSDPITRTVILDIPKPCAHCEQHTPAMEHMPGRRIGVEMFTPIGIGTLIGDPDYESEITAHQFYRCNAVTECSIGKTAFNFILPFAGSEQFRLLIEIDLQITVLDCIDDQLPQASCRQWRKRQHCRGNLYALVISSKA